MAKNYAFGSAKPRSERLARAFDAAMAAAPGNADDDADAWRANIAKRREVFAAEYGTAPNDTSPPTGILIEGRFSGEFENLSGC